MKKTILILMLVIASVLSFSQTTPNFIKNFTISKDSVFAYRVFNNYAWHMQVVISAPSATDATIEVVQSNDGIHWALYNSAMYKLISQISKDGTTYWVDFEDKMCGASYIGLRFTHNSAATGTLNAILNLKQP